MLAYRRLYDEDGRCWEVWESRPSIIDRRDGRDRRVGYRQHADRRQLTEPRLPVPASHRNGWLCFQCGDELHRVAPIPGDWLMLEGTELLGLLRDNVSAAC